MKRLIDWHLINWKTHRLRQPLLLHGARQVGKTYAVQELGKTFDTYVEINFEQDPGASVIFDKSLQVKELIIKLESFSKKSQI